MAKGNNDGGLTCIMMADAEPNVTVDNTNVVSNCQFLNLKGPEFSDLPYTQCCTCLVVSNNKATGVDALWFLEPGTQVIGNNVFYSGQTVQITGNTTTDSGQVAMILMHPNGNFAGSLSVQNNTVGMTQHPYFKEDPRRPMGVSVEQYQAGNPPVGSITVQNNTFIAPLPKASSPYAVSENPGEGSRKYFHFAKLTVLNNTLVNFPRDGKEMNVTRNPADNPELHEHGEHFYDRDTALNNQDFIQPFFGGKRTGVQEMQPAADLPENPVPFRRSCDIPAGPPVSDSSAPLVTTAN